MFRKKILTPENNFLLTHNELSEINKTNANISHGQSYQSHIINIVPTYEYIVTL